MSILKFLSITVVGLTMAAGGGSTAFAKAHDQGVADGVCGRDKCGTVTILSPGIANHNTYTLGRGSVVSGVDTPGVGSAKNTLTCSEPFLGVTCGVAAEGDKTYGQDVVRLRVEAGKQGVNGGAGPVTRNK